MRALSRRRVEIRMENVEAKISFTYKKGQKSSLKIEFAWCFSWKLFIFGKHFVGCSCHLSSLNDIRTRAGSDKSNGCHQQHVDTFVQLIKFDCILSVCLENTNTLIFHSLPRHSILMIIIMRDESWTNGRRKTKVTVEYDNLYAPQ